MNKPDEFDWLDQQLASSEDYLADDGFTEALMGRLPPVPLHGRSFNWTLLLPIIAAVLALGIVAIVLPGSRALGELLMNPASPHSIALASVLVASVFLSIWVNQVVFGMDLLDEIPKGDSRAGTLLHQILPFLFRSHRQHLAVEGIYLHDAVALTAVLQPELFESEMMAGDVETSGELTLGATVFDRRTVKEATPNIEVMTSADVSAVKDCVIRGLQKAVRETS